MEYKSPLTEYVIEPFDSYLESKNNLNCDNMASLHISFVLMTLSFYYFTENIFFFIVIKINSQLST